MERSERKHELNATTAGREFNVSFAEISLIMTTHTHKHHQHIHKTLVIVIKSKHQLIFKISEVGVETHGGTHAGTETHTHGQTHICKHNRTGLE